MRREKTLVQRNCFAIIPESAKLGDRVVVRFQIQKDGTLRVKEPMVEASSNKGLLDKAAVNAIRLSAPFQHLPEAFRGHTSNSVSHSFIIYRQNQREFPTLLLTDTVRLERARAIGISSAPCGP